MYQVYIPFGKSAGTDVQFLQVPATTPLPAGKFTWAPLGSPNVALEHAQLNALVLGLPWQRMGSQGAITVI